MTASTHRARLGATLWFAAAFAWHGAAAQPASNLPKPKIGQEGKDAIWVPTPPALVKKMLDLAKVSVGDTLVDLGSGDGRMVIAAAKRGATARGIEYDPALVALSRANAAREGVSDKATFEQADIFATDFSTANVVALFLLPQLNEKLRPTILNMRPGTRVVSNTFELGAWYPDEIAALEEECDFFFCKALLWIVPARIDGRWSTDKGELSLKQEFQTFTGTLANGNVIVPIAGGRVKGDKIAFTAGGVEYTGTVGGATIEGTTKSGETWKAKRDP